MMEGRINMLSLSKNKSLNSPIKRDFQVIILQLHMLVTNEKIMKQKLKIKLCKKQTMQFKSYCPNWEKNC